jgi:cytochrome c biogenesis protein CcmG, thiol:disulfide interchange protein DsbE
MTVARGQLTAVGVGLAVALLAAACGGPGRAGAPSGSPPSREQAAGALAALRAQANQLLSGGAPAFGRRLAVLRGHPVVVNQWASWCDPCRYEFPYFARLARKYQGRVAFLGVDSQDARAAGARFLKENPVPYPSYYDRDTSIARLFRGGFAWPTTAFYDASGKLTFTHAGAYATQAKLEVDIRRYGLHA